MPFTVFLTADAARDLEELYDYIALHDASRKADCVLEQIEKAFSKWSEFPERGAYPKELLALGIRENREIFFKPYRINYRVKDKNIYVLLIHLFSGKGEYFEIGASDESALTAFLLRRERAKSGLTLAEVARKLGSKSLNTYARYEQGRTVPTVPKLSELLSAVASRKDFVLTESQA